MTENSHSEALWQVLHQANALLTQGGYAEALPPLPASSSLNTEGYDDLAARYGEALEFGAGWPAGQGPGRPQALILCSQPLTDEAVGFVRSWFENPKVNLRVADAFFLQALPLFEARTPPLAPAFVKDLCTLLQPKAVLSLGAVPAQTLLGAPLSQETLQGSDFRFHQWSIVTTLDPEKFAELADADKNRFKAQVWRDLQRLLGKLKYG